MTSRSWPLLIPVLGVLACDGGREPRESIGSSSTGTSGSTSTGPTDPEPMTSSSTDGSGSGSDTGGDGGLFCDPIPEGREACEPIDWGYYFTYAITAPEDHGVMTASCAVYATVSGRTGSPMSAHDTGLVCDFGSGTDRVFAARVVVGPDATHPLRPGDRVTLDAEMSIWGRGAFALRDEATGELVMGAHSGLGDPSPERFAPLQWEPTYGGCVYEAFPSVDECYGGAAPYWVEVSLGQDSVSMTDGDSASVGHLDVFVSAVDYWDCGSCFDNPSGHTVAIFGDGFDGPANDDCHLFAQNCPDDGRCVPVSSGSGVWDATACVPAGALGDGDGCVPADPTTGMDDCGAGLVCVVDDEAVDGGRCRPTCDGTVDAPECSAAGERCNLQPAGDTPPLVCVPRCTPLGNDCGEPEKGCYHVADLGFVCANAGGAGHGEACDYINSCEAGLTCVGGSVVDGCASGSCCAAFCSLGDPSCDQGTCTPYLEESVPGYEDLGICITPEP